MLFCLSFLGWQVKGRQAGLALNSISILSQNLENHVNIKLGNEIFHNKKFCRSSFTTNRHLMFWLWERAAGSNRPLTCFANTLPIRLSEAVTLSFIIRENCIGILFWAIGICKTREKDTTQRHKLGHAAVHLISHRPPQRLQKNVQSYFYPKLHALHLLVLLLALQTKSLSILTKQRSREEQTKSQHKNKKK